MLQQYFYNCRTFDENLLLKIRVRKCKGILHLFCDKQLPFPTHHGTVASTMDMVSVYSFPQINDSSELFKIK